MNLFVHFKGLFPQFPEKWPKKSNIQSSKEIAEILLENLLEKLGKHMHIIMVPGKAGQLSACNQ